MRVLAMTNLYPNPFQPHRATFNRHQFRLLNDRHPVRVIAPVLWTDELAARRDGQLPLPASRRVTHDGLTVDHPRYIYPPNFGRQWYGHCYRASVAKAFRRAIVEFSPDLVFAPWAYPDGWAAVWLGRKVGLPVVLQCHGSDVLLLDQHPPRKRPTVEAVTAADGVVAVSQDIAEHLAHMGVPADRLRVIIDGVDRRVFHPGAKTDARRAVGLPDGPPVILFIGGLVGVKAIDVLLDACGVLNREDFPVRVVIVGGGPLGAKLEQQAATLGLVDRVRFTGMLPQHTLPDWYRAADLFVLPSHSEGVPNVLLEASACGTPWVASRVGGIPEIAHLGVNRLVPPNKPAELAAAVRQLLSASPQPRPCGPKSREEAVVELEAFLEEILDRRGGRVGTRGPRPLVPSTTGV